MTEVLGTIAAIFGVIWIVGAVIFARRYYVRRHGVRLKHFGGNDLSIGLIVAAFIGAMWPFTIFFPSLRSPQLCTCPDHLLARQQQRSYEDSVLEALRQEREESS